MSKSRYVDNISALFMAKFEVLSPSCIVVGHAYLIIHRCKASRARVRAELCCV